MLHLMNLWDNPYQAIKSGQKTIEMRLFDEKKRNIHVGDLIQFTNIKSKETITCSVIKLYYYDSFNELYKHHDKIAIGYLVDEIANPDDMLIYYKKEDMEKYGVVGIEIKLIV